MGKPKPDSNDPNQSTNTAPGNDQAGSTRAGNAQVSKKTPPTVGKTVNPAKSPQSGFFISDDDNLLDELQLGWGLTDEQDELDAIISRTLDKPRQVQRSTQKEVIEETNPSVAEDRLDKAQPLITPPPPQPVTAPSNSNAEPSNAGVNEVSPSTSKPTASDSEPPQSVLPKAESESQSSEKIPPQRLVKDVQPVKPVVKNSPPAPVTNIHSQPIVAQEAPIPTTSPVPVHSSATPEIISKAQVEENSRAAIRKAQREAANKSTTSGTNTAQSQPIEIPPYTPANNDTELPSFLSLDPPKESPPLEFTGFVTPSFDPNEFVPTPYQGDDDEEGYYYDEREPGTEHDSPDLYEPSSQNDYFDPGIESVIPEDSSVPSFLSNQESSEAPIAAVIQPAEPVEAAQALVAENKISSKPVTPPSLEQSESKTPPLQLSSETQLPAEKAVPKKNNTPAIQAPQSSVSSKSVNQTVTPKPVSEATPVDTSSKNLNDKTPTKPSAPAVSKVPPKAPTAKPVAPLEQEVEKPIITPAPPSQESKPVVAKEPVSPVAKPAEKAIDKVVDRVVERPAVAESQASKPVEKPVEMPVDKPVGKPVAKTSESTSVKSAPVEEPPAKVNTPVKQKIEGPIVVDVNKEMSRDLQSETSTLISKFTPQQGLFGKIEQLAKDEQKVKDAQRAKEIADAAEAAAKVNQKLEDEKPKSKLARTAAEEMAALLAEEEIEEKEQKIEAPARTIKKTLLEDKVEQIKESEPETKQIKKTLLEASIPNQDKQADQPSKAIKKTLLEKDAPQPKTPPDASISRHRMNALEPSDDTPLTGLIKTIKQSTTPQDIARMSTDNEDVLPVEDKEALAEQAEVAAEKREEIVAVGNFDAIADAELEVPVVDSRIEAEIRKNLGANVDISVPSMPPPMKEQTPPPKPARDIKAEIRESVKEEGPEKKVNILKALKQLEEQLDDSDLDKLSTDSIKDVLAKLPNAKARQIDDSLNVEAAKAAKRAASKSRSRLQPAEEPTAEREIAREKLKVMQKMASKLPSKKSYVVQKRIAIVVSAAVIVLTLAGVLAVRASTINAKQALAKKDYKGALNSLNIALALYPLSAEAHFLRGSALYLSNDLKGAYTEYDTALSLNPTMHDALERRAAVSYQLGNNAQAISDYEKLLQGVSPQSHRFDQLLKVGVAYHRNGDLQHALDYYNRSIDKKNNHVPALVGKASISFDRKQFERTVFDCTKGLTAVPGNRELLLLRARANTELNNFASAQADIDTLFKRSNSDGQAYATRAMLRLAQKRTEQAMTDANKAVKLDSKDPSVYLDRSKVFVAMKKFDAAGKDLEKAHNILGNKKTAQMALAHAQFLSISNKRAEAVAELKEASIQFPQNVQIVLSLADALAASGKLSEAIATTEKAIEQGKTNVDAQLKHGQLSLKFGNKMRATEDFAQVISLDPRNETAYLERGKLFLLEEKYASAQEDFAKSLAINPSNQEAKQNLEKARRLFASIVRVRPQANQQSGPSDAYLAGLASKDFATLLSDGFKAYQRGDHATAVPTLEQAVKVNPQSAQARRYLAYAYKANDQLDDAVLQFDALSPLGTLSTPDILNYTELLIGHGAGTKAIKILDDAIAKNPGVQGYYLKLALAQSGTGDKAGSVQSCNKGIAINPRSAIGQELIVLRNRILTGDSPGSPSQEENKSENQS